MNWRHVLPPRPDRKMWMDLAISLAVLAVLWLSVIGLYAVAHSLRRI